MRLNFTSDYNKGIAGTYVKEGQLTFSLSPFVQYLNRWMDKHPDHRLSGEFRTRLQHHFAVPGMYEIPEADIALYEDIYQLIYQFIVPPLQEEETLCWGLSFPFSSRIIYGTDGLFSIFNEKRNGRFVEITDLNNSCKLPQTDIPKFIFYSFLVRHFYNIHIFPTSDLIFRISSEDTDMYYQLEYDDRFIEASFDGMLPDIDKRIKEMENISMQNALQYLEKILPLEKIRLSGFSIIEVKNITTKALKEQLRHLLLTSDVGEVSPDKISQIVRRLSGCQHLDLLFLPILYMNNRIVTALWQPMSEKLNELLHKYNIGRENFDRVMKEYVQHPRLIFRENVQRQKQDNSDLDLLITSGLLEGVIVKPVFSKDQLIGVIWMASQCADVISEVILTYLEEFMPLIQILFEATVGNYKNALGNVIKSKFTSIQPSVEWKFNEAALQYLKDKMTEAHPTLLPIKFENIYPLYGAIDFRDSTVERNKAELEDWILQLEMLIAVIRKIEQLVPLEMLGEIKYQSQRWIDNLKLGMDANKTLAVKQFLEQDVYDVLTQLGQSYADLQPILQTYWDGMEPEGTFHNNSLELEKTFKILNYNIASILDQMNDKLQAAYPCYFERYRTDGVEFNVYIGQSIRPDVPFSPIYLRNAELWQLNTMALIAKVTEKSQQDLPRKIHTTQLIFVHSNTITISFRTDERHFDVEGGYNIRYEIIKKRIDKAVIKGTGARLTQPGKIAIVYFQKKDIQDYLQHINYLQKMNILSKELEYVELEDMQGVAGLKALRVSISEDHEPTMPKNAAAAEEVSKLPYIVNNLNS